MNAHSSSSSYFNGLSTQSSNHDLFIEIQTRKVFQNATNCEDLQKNLLKKHSRGRKVHYNIPSTPKMLCHPGEGTAFFESWHDTTKNKNTNSFEKFKSKPSCCWH